MGNHGGHGKAIAAFWDTFVRLAGDLAHTQDANTALYDELLAALQCVHAGLYVEFSTGEAPHELIITADGDTSLFSLVHDIVARAPVMAGWTFLALKPQVGVAETFGFRDVELRAEDVFFEPLRLEGSRALGLEFIVRGLASAHIEDAHNAILRATDLALGEKTFATTVEHTRVRALKPERGRVRASPL